MMIFEYAAGEIKMTIAIDYAVEGVSSSTSNSTLSSSSSSSSSTVVLVVIVSTILRAKPTQ